MQTFANTRGIAEPVPLSASQAVEQLPDPAVFLLDRNGRAASWNEGVRRLLGWEQNEWIGQPLGVVFTPEDVAAGVPHHDMAEAAAKGHADHRHWLQSRSGERFEALDALTPLRGAQGQLLGFWTQVRPAAAAAPAAPAALPPAPPMAAMKPGDGGGAPVLPDQSALPRAAPAEAARLHLLQSDFLSTIAHELRTPLSAILAWANVLEHGSADAQTLRRGLAAIARNARLQAALINKLLDLGRIDLGQLQLQPQRLQLDVVVAAAVAAAQAAAAAKNVTLQTSLQPATATVMADPARLQQVLVQLLDNAIKFSATGGSVRASLWNAGPLVQVAVADDGAGIEAALVDSMFDRFQQPDSAPTPPARALGLGLSLVRRLVHLHGGNVAVRSKGRGYGAVFTMSLPAVDGDTARADAQAAAIADVATPGLPSAAGPPSRSG